MGTEDRRALPAPCRPTPPPQSLSKPGLSGSRRGDGGRGLSRHLPGQPCCLLIERGGLSPRPRVPDGGFKPLLGPHSPSCWGRSQTHSGTGSSDPTGQGPGPRLPALCGCSCGSGGVIWLMGMSEGRKTSAALWQNKRTVEIPPRALLRPPPPEQAQHQEGLRERKFPGVHLFGSPEWHLLGGAYLSWSLVSQGPGTLSLITRPGQEAWEDPLPP